MEVIYGKKVILFDFLATDLDHFVKLHRDDKKGYLQHMCLKKMTEDEAKDYVKALIISGQIKIYSVFTKEGKASKRIGFIYLGEKSSFSCSTSGIMDMDIAKGLLKQIRKGKYTWAEDSYQTLIKHCFNGMGMQRLTTTVLSNNRRSIKLTEKVGFVKEGRLRKAFKMDDKYYDIIQYGLLKEDLKCHLKEQNHQ
jgi:hypothetical protein